MQEVRHNLLLIPAFRTKNFKNKNTLSGLAESQPDTKMRERWDDGLLSAVKKIN